MTTSCSRRMYWLLRKSDAGHSIRDCTYAFSSPLSEGRLPFRGAPMRCACVVALAAASGIALAACSESRDSFPTSPQFKPSPPGFVCDLNNATLLARQYFAQPTQNQVVALIGAMEPPASAGVRTARGLDVFERVALGTDVVGTTQIGSDLLNAIGACSSLNQTAPIDWLGPLGPQGGFAVVGAGSEPVFSRDGFSAVAPPAGSSWSAWLDLPDLEQNLPDSRAAVYGAPFPVTSGLSPEAVFGARGFDWSTLPVRPFPLNGDGFLGICIGLGATGRIQNNHSDAATTLQGILGLADPDDVPFALLCTGFDDSGNPLTTGLFRRVIDALAPQPLFAAAGTTPPKIVTPGGWSKNFGVTPTGLQMAFVLQPEDGLVGQTLAPVEVQVVTVNNLPVQNVGVTIDVLANLGQPAQLSGTLTRKTNEFGIARFDDLKIFSAGGYSYHATTSDGRGGLQPAQATSTMFHVKNKK